MKNKNTKVIVAMSGGVDSSVSAALLKEAGFDVTGVFMRCWGPSDFSGQTQISQACTAEEDEYWARRAAASIGIPFYSFDLVEDYKKRVVDYFVSEYRSGRTPNPDIMCNDQIKFGVFFDKAIKELGADYIATGHYARVDHTRGKTRLLKGVDPNKDQTYFLHRLSADKLARVMFPIGSYPKPQVREMARTFKLPNAEKKDSQGLCFIGKVDVQQFLTDYIPQKVGDLVTTSGEIIGEHEGIHNYTIGQRRGIGVGGGIPYYVVAKDIGSNTIIVGTEYDKALFSKSLRLSDMRWVGPEPDLPLSVQANIRYRQEPEPAVLKAGREDEFILEFENPQRAVTSGQSAVVYDNDEVLGGGVIV